MLLLGNQQSCDAKECCTEVLHSSLSQETPGNKVPTGRALWRDYDQEGQRTIQRSLKSLLFSIVNEGYNNQ